MMEIIYLLSKRYSRKAGLDLPYFIKNGFWVMIRQIIVTACGIIFFIVFTRLATLEVFGQYQLILSILSIISILSVPGLNTSIIRSVARGYDGDYKKVVEVSFFWSLLGIPILFLMGGYFYLYQNHPMGIALMVSSIFFPFLYAPNTWDSFLQGKGRFDISTKYSSIQVVLNSIATIAVILLSKGNLIFIMLMYLFSYTFFNGYYFLKSFEYIKNKKRSSDVVSYGWFLTKMNFLGIVANNIDSVLVGILLGPIDLAIYSIVSLVAIKLKDLTKSIGIMFIPKIAITEIKLSDLFRTHKIKILIMILIVFIFSSLYYFFIPNINELFFSDKYSSYSYLSRFFSITVFLSAFLSLFSYYNSAKKNKFVIKITNPIFFSIKIILNTIFIYKLGLLGAVLAFNISMILWMVLFIFSTIYIEKVRFSS